MTQKVDRMLDLLVLVGYSVAFPVKLAKRLSGQERGKAAGDPFSAAD